jgi:MFS family permease
VALVLIAYQRLHSGWAIALVLLADFLPGILLSAYFGMLADRHSRRRLTIAAELLRAVAFLGLAYLGSFGATVALALAAGIGTALFRPALGAALPTLVAPEERSRATSLYGVLHDLGLTMGPAVCGGLLLLGPMSWVLLLNAVTFAVSALLLAGVPLDGSGEGRDEDSGALARGREQTRRAFRDAARQPGVGATLLIGAASVLCGAIINVAEPVLATGPLHAGRSGFSVLVAVYGAGMVAGSAYTSRLSGRISVLWRNFLAGVGLAGLAMLLCGEAGSLGQAVAPFAIAGFANAVIVVPQPGQGLRPARERGVHVLRSCVPRRRRSAERGRPAGDLRPQRDPAAGARRGRLGVLQAWRRKAAPARGTCRGANSERGVRLGSRPQIPFHALRSR